MVGGLFRLAYFSKPLNVGAGGGGERYCRTKRCSKVRFIDM